MALPRQWYRRVISAALAIQMFMPGMPQVWYLDVSAGGSHYEAADLASLAFTVRHRDNSGNESLLSFNG